MKLLDVWAAQSAMGRAVLEGVAEGIDLGFGQVLGEGLLVCSERYFHVIVICVGVV